MGSESRFGAAAKEYWDDAMRKVGARVAHARGEISDEQLRAALGPPPPPGSTLSDAMKAIRRAPEGTFAGMLRRTGQELLAAAAKRTANRGDVG